VFENRVLRTIFGPKTEAVTGGRGNCIMKSFVIYTVHQILLENLKEKETIW
jgi:hypothetical protein